MYEEEVTTRLNPRVSYLLVRRSSTILFEACVGQSRTVE